MSAVERARAWLHGDADADPRQLVRDLIAAVGQASEREAGDGARWRFLVAQGRETHPRFAVSCLSKHGGWVPTCGKWLESDIDDAMKESPSCGCVPDLSCSDLKDPSA